MEYKGKYTKLSLFILNYKAKKYLKKKIQKLKF